MEDQEKSEASERSGPEPERLKLPHRDWKEALKELFRKADSERGRPVPEDAAEDRDEGEDESGG